MITKCEFFFMDYFYKRQSSLCYLHDNNNGSIWVNELATELLYLISFSLGKYKA
jgi:hypothetical protein